MNPEDRACKLVRFAVPGDDPGRVEHAVPSVQPAVGSPRQGIGQLVSVVAAEAGHDDFPKVSLAVAVAILQEENIGRIGYPDPSMADGNSRRDVEAVREDCETVGLAVAVGVVEDLDAIASGPWASAVGIPGFR